MVQGNLRRRIVLVSREMTFIQKKKKKLTIIMFKSDVIFNVKIADIQEMFYVLGIFSNFDHDGAAIMQKR